MLLAKGNGNVEPDVTCRRVVEHDCNISQSRHRLVLLAANPGGSATDADRSRILTTCSSSSSSTSLIEVGERLANVAV
jgi:hypothetical protein